MRIFGVSQRLKFFCETEFKIVRALLFNKHLLTLNNSLFMYILHYMRVKTN